MNYGNKGAEWRAKDGIAVIYPPFRFFFQKHDVRSAVTILLYSPYRRFVFLIFYPSRFVRYEHLGNSIALSFFNAAKNSPGIEGFHATVNLAGGLPEVNS